jgi:periplasmic protein CpxP/Spy
MKKVILAFSIMLALTATTFAQNAAPAQDKGKEKGMEMKQKGKEKGEQGHKMGDQGKGQMGSNLGLTPDQETKFKAFNESHKEAVKKVDMDKTLSADAKKTQIDALKGQYEANVKTVMNADQYTKWSAMRAKRNDKMEEHKDKKEEHKGKMEDHKEKMGDKKGKAKSDKAKSDKDQPQGTSKSN